MSKARTRLLATNAIGLALALFVAACSGNGGSSSTSTPDQPGNPPPDNPPSCDGAQEFSSTFEGIQKEIFEKHGCTQDICHGSAAHQGGLDLTPAVAYQNIFDTPATGVSMKRIEPGDKDRSYLWLKLAAATNPGSVQISGSPMPNGLPPLSPDELELVRRWIYAGAPETGTVQGTAELLDACLPDPEPIVIKPLDPPAAGTGVQFVLPQWHLPAHSEHENCFATYYDITQQTPAAFNDPSGQMFRFKGFDLRQDPQSHHLLLYYSPLNFQPGGIDVHDPSFGTWTCRGGVQEGQECEPKDLTSCGSDGVCTSQLEPSFACIGYGPESEDPAQIMGGAGQSQAYFPFLDGVFAQLPMKGVIYWNSHAFNLTDEDTEMNGRINYLFAEQQVHPVEQIAVFDAIFDPNAAPYTVGTYCNDVTFPVGSRIFHLFAHMHKHGKHFWATLPPDGNQIYETFSYNDPTQQRYDPPLALDSPDRKQRTIRYCGTYNNGVNDDGSPNPETVTRLSRIPESAKGNPGGTCTPIACTAGRVGAACSGADDNASCDSSPGAGDGKCDACPITGGESTENEMFVLFGAMYIDETAAAQALGLEAPAQTAGRSDVTGPIFPNFQGCVAPKRGMQAAMAHAALGLGSPGMSHGDHAGHTGHAEHAGHGSHDG
ncbi:MAG TPA: hypothetical protein VFD92_00320 [Candidatus Binatia bacterium]|nr:hypothetical protein [Candidatus Binatia bacterium]